MAPRFAKHGMRVYQVPALFKRVDAVMQEKDKLGLTQEQKRVIERYHRSFVRSGAALDAKSRKRLAAIAEKACKPRQPSLNQNVLADEQSFLMVVDDPDLRACRMACVQPLHNWRGSAASTPLCLQPRAFQRGRLAAVLRQPRPAREGLFAWRNRGANGGKTDNRKLIRR